ncbi:glycosyltransferase family 4 protein [Sphingomonas koreensis]|nr:glycosyltransferase family 4 protein [Sphingomonas koreensis]
MTDVVPIGSAPPSAGRSIAIVVAALGAGGAERVVAWLAGHWLARGAQVTVISFDAEGDAIYHAFPAGVRFVRLGIPARRGRRWLPPPLSRIVALRRAVTRIEPDLVVSFLTKINVLTLAATIGLSIPVVVAERNNPEHQPAHPLWRFALPPLYRRAAAIVCQTHASRRCIPAASRSRIWVIANPVTPAREPLRHPRPRTIAAVGRLESQKGFDLLIDAFARIAERQRGWRLELWGSGPDADALRERIAAHRLDDRIALRGLSERPGGWIAETGIFVLPSRYEGFPNVLGEAMAAGLPVIAADCDFGPAELVIDGDNGLLVPRENVAALATALDRLIGDSGLRERLAAAAPLVVDRFSSRRIAAEWDSLTTTLLG